MFTGFRNFDDGFTILGMFFANTRLNYYFLVFYLLVIMMITSRHASPAKNRSASRVSTNPSVNPMLILFGSEASLSIQRLKLFYEKIVAVSNPEQH